MNKKLILTIAGILLAIGILKPNFSNIYKPHNIVVVDNNELDLLSPPSENLKSKANNVIKALSINNDRKVDGKKLASLFNDMATLIQLDGENEVIRNTEEIRQANRLAGPMLKLDIKDKYKDLPEAAQSLILEAIGDDNVLLNKELRAKAVEGFKVLAWACYEGSK